MAIWGTDCGRVKLSGKMIKSVSAKNGNESKLYKDILEQLDTLPKEEVDQLRESFKDWEGDIVGDVDNKRHLALALYAKTNSPNFKKWFGNSKVVDENGEPLLVYHGTPNGEFNSFNSDYTGKNTLVNDTKGFYFSDSYKTAKYYAEGSIDFDSFGSYDEYLAATKDKIKIMPVFLSGQVELIKNPQSVQKKGNIIFRTEKPLDDVGETSLGIYKKDIAHQYIVFEPNQIKSLFNEGAYSEKDENIYKQLPTEKEETKPSKASEVTVDEFKEFLKRAGIPLNEMVKGRVDENGNPITPENAAYISERLVNVIDGEQATALPEEASHHAVQYIKIHDPKLFKAMMNKVGNYDLYGEIAEQYKNDSAYKLEDGKPNIPKIKEETLTRLFVENVIKIKEGSTEKPELVAQTQTWWKQVIESLRSFFNTGSFDPFRKAAKQFVEKEGAFSDENVKNKVDQLRDWKPSENFKDFSTNTIENFKGVVEQVPDHTAIVTHGTVISLLKTWKDNKYQDGEVSMDVFQKQEINNGHIEEIDYNGKKIFLVRHGESEANVDDVESTDNTPLTQKGKEDAMKVAQELRDKGIVKIVSTETDRTKGTAEIIRKELGLSDKFAQVDKQKATFDAIVATLNKIKKEVTADENYYLNVEKNKKVQNRITDRAQRIVDAAFGDREISEEQRKEWDQKAATGSAGHDDIANIFSRYIDKTTGFVRKKNGQFAPLDMEGYVSKINPDNDDYYSMLEKMMRDVISEYPENTRFIWETPIYNELTDEAGTPDFLAILPDGTVDNLDWKFLDIKDNVKDIAKYKKKAFNVQMKGYAEILRNSYGVEKIGRSRIMPIQAKYKFDDITGQKIFAGIEIANSEDNYKGEKRDYLIPLPSEVETVRENSEIQDQVEKMNKLLDQLSKQKKEEISEDKKRTYEQRIAEVMKAIRYAQVKKDATSAVESISGYLNEIGPKFKEYMKIFEEGKESQYTLSDLNRMADEVYRSYEYLAPFYNLEHVYKDPETKAMLYDLSYRISEAGKYMDKLSALLIEKGVANRFNLFGVAGTDPMTGKPFADQLVSWGKKLWTTSANAKTRAGQLFHHVRDLVYQKSTFKNMEVQDGYDKIAQPVLEWVKKRSRKELDKLLLKQGKDQWGLHDKYSKEFDTKLQEAQKDGDLNWIVDNIKLKDYMIDYEERFNKYMKWATEYFSNYTDNTSRNEQLLEEAKTDFQKKYDIKAYPKTAIAISNDRLKRFPTDTWFSNEYKELNKSENAPLLEMYNYMQKRFKEAHDIGILDHNYMHFIPMAPNSFVETVTWGDNKFKNIVRNLGSSVTLRPFDAGYTNPITREPEDKLLARYVSDLSSRDAEGKKDYSNLSRDVLSLMPLFNLEMVKYEYAKDIEGIVKLLLKVEKNKPVLRTNSWGEPVVKEGRVQMMDSPENYEYLRKMIDSHFYGKSGSDDQKGWGFKFDYNGMANKVNKFMGSDVMPLSEDEKVFVSFPKLIETVNRNLTIKALGVNPFSALSNYFGGNFQAWINTGEVERDDFDFAKVLIGKNNFLATEETKVIGGLMQYFSPFTAEETNENARKYSLNDWNKWLSTHTLMTMMRGSDHSVEMVTSLALMKNLMVVDGKLVNIWSHLKEKYNYSSIYSMESPQARKVIIDKMKAEYKDLKEKNSIVKTSKIVDGKIEIPDLIKNDTSIFTARAKMQKMVMDALGNRTPYQKMQIDQNIFGASLMVFHHWIPPLVNTRFDNLQYVASAQTYKWGRWKMLGAALHEKGIGAFGHLISHLSNSDEDIIATAKALYQKKRQEFLQTGEISNFDKNMTEADFIDMYKKNMEANFIDALSTLSLISAYYAATAMAPDKDKKGRGWYKASLKMLDKFSDELAFFYSPASFYRLVGNAKLPIVNTALNTYKFLKAAGKELYYDAKGDKEAAEKNKVLNRVINEVPLINQAVNFWTMFDDDLSVEIKGKVTPDDPNKPL